MMMMTRSLQRRCYTRRGREPPSTYHKDDSCAMSCPCSASCKTRFPGALPLTCKGERISVIQKSKNNLIGVFLVALLTICSFNAASRGEAVVNGTITSEATVQNALAVATNNSHAQIAGVSVIGNSSVQGRITTKDTISNALAVATNNSLATIGGVTIINARVNGTITSTANVKNALAVATNNSRAIIASVVIDGGLR